MTIGLHTQVAIQQNEREKRKRDMTTSSSMTSSFSSGWNQTLKDKRFNAKDRSRSELLEIKYAEVGLDGLEKEPQTITDSFHVVAAMNLPAYRDDSGHDNKRCMDPAFPMDCLPDPTSHALDVCLVGGQGNVHDILKKKELKQSDVTNLNSSLKEETDQLSVAWMDIRSKSGKPLFICIDGKISGPFVRLFIKPCEAIGKGTPLSFPVMHFFPRD